MRSHLPTRLLASILTVFAILPGRAAGQTPEHPLRDAVGATVVVTSIVVGSLVLLDSILPRCTGASDKESAKECDPRTAVNRRYEALLGLTIGLGGAACGVGIVRWEQTSAAPASDRTALLVGLGLPM